MNANPNCPVCGAYNWEILGHRTYRLCDLPGLNEYCMKRYRVLFEVWVPGETEFTIRCQLCNTCGFVLYAPRPTLEELEQKYRFLNNLACDTGDKLTDVQIEKMRARELYRKATRWAVRGAKRVLDFGGGEGRLMEQFLAHGWDCSLVDYTPHAVPGVKRLGATLADLDQDLRFDLIVCSHVLEHLGDPLATVVALRRHLTELGTLYVEVPMEIWRRAPLPEEPVTHVNFFTVDSLRFLLERAGYNVLSCRLGSHLHSTGSRMTVVRAWGRRAPHGTCVSPLPGAALRTRELLSPKWRTHLSRLLARPDLFFKRLSRLLPCNG